MNDLPLMLGLFGVVILVSALLSGFVERSGFPQVAVFLAIGLTIGSHGLGLMDFGLDSPLLRSVATLSLTLVLFTDALTLNIAEARRHLGLAALILIPGTIVSTALIGVGAVAILGVSVPLAALIAAPLASTDPVLLRGLLRRPSLPSEARQALRLESGLNDVVLLPIVLVAAAVITGAQGAGGEIGWILVRMLVLGPGVGALLAWVGVRLLEVIRNRVGVRRDYESLYSIGVALAAFAVGELLHSSGFLSAFAAGLVIAALDVELCDCFREYGETTAELLLLFTFVLLGTSLMWTGVLKLTLAVTLFAVVALAARPLTLALGLASVRIERKAKRQIVWYGPRGLSTLLLILVPVFAKVPQSEELLHVSTVVVLLSILVHGSSIMLSGSREDERPTNSADGGAAASDAALPVGFSTSDVLRLAEGNEKLWLLDARSEASYLRSTETLSGSFRIHPQHARRDAMRLGVPKDAWAALFCT